MRPIYTLDSFDASSYTLTNVQLKHFVVTLLEVSLIPFRHVYSDLRARALHNKVFKFHKMIVYSAFIVL